MPIIQFGVGNVGRALIQQVVDNRARHEQLGLRLQVVALCDHDGAVVQERGLADEQLEAILRAKARGTRLRHLEWGYYQDDLTAIVDVAGTNEAIVVDVTASDQTIPALLAALERGYGLVLANKLPLAGSYPLFQQLTAGRGTRYETTVGAGLPVVATLQTLLDTGDTVERIQGCLSGTVGFICARLEAGEPFSAAVREARARGYTEPDPREDLAGYDAARKALILARMLGYPLELEDVAVERLYPPHMDALSVEEFMSQVEALDAEYAERAAQVRDSGQRLRYVAEVVEGHCRVELQAVPPDSRLAHIQASDSIVLFQTARYHENPLTISGRGAGPEVTAAGVLGDILALAHRRENC
ncbi:MAG: homoserine dehydrogenase [Anaerolineae bacterium]